MRKCERCLGPGPTLYDDGRGPKRQNESIHRYVCRACHSNPADPVFARHETPTLPPDPAETDRARRSHEP